MKSSMLLLLATLFLSLPVSALGQATEPVIHPDDPFMLKKMFIPRTFHPEHITKKPGHYTITDWNDVIDQTWGWGESKSEKLRIFDTFWNVTDAYFAAFVNLPGYYPEMWNELRVQYRSEIVNGDPTYGVSRGRFAAIMNYLAMALVESHTNAVDLVVCTQTNPDPGVPLLVIGYWGPEPHFGAGLTPLDDNTLLVYKALPNHPLGLEPGDRVLGYDGVPWSDLYLELLAAQLPEFYAGWWGSSEYAFDYSMMMSGGLNWHLFDVMDVVKYNTGETVHLPTAPLDGGLPWFQETEQVEVPGVPMPDMYAGERVSYGIISGTQIGYIYVMAWSFSVESEFYNAVSALMNDYETTGLIIDYRTNYGGRLVSPLPGLSLLYNTRELTVEYGNRCSPDDHLSMCPQNYYGWFVIPGNSANYYDRPIAVLVGPGAVSVGDHAPLWMKSHPMVRIFGRPTSGAYGPVNDLDLGNPDWYSRYTPWNTFLTSDPGNYLVHSMLEVDDDVWLTPDDVAQGHDTVVEAAEAWINSFAGLQPEIAYDPQSIEISVEYGQTATQDLTLQNVGTRHLFYSLTPQTENRLWYDSDKDNSVHISMPPREPDPIDIKSSEVAGMEIEPRFPPIITGHGGPDAYGYIWTDSDQPHGPAHRWIDISGNGTLINLGNNSYAGPFSIGFDFAFYGNSYSELYIGSNGLITFGSGSSFSNNVGIPSSGSPNDLIAMWWDDLNPAAQGDVYYYDDEINGRFIVSFVDIPSYSYGGSLTFQAVLYPDGQIDLNYNTMEHGDFGAMMAFATIGIENSDGSDGLEVVYNAQYVHDNLSIKIMTDWMGITPYAGHIAVGENAVATVTFNTGNFPPGSYSGNIYLDSDDPDDPLIMIPVSLEITSGCDYIAGDCNHNGTPLELGDVVTMIGLYRGTLDPAYSCPCPPHGEDFTPEADPNGNCVAFELGDVVTEIGAYRGSTEASGCPDCPGSLRLLPDSPGELSVTPRLKSRANAEEMRISE